MPKDINIQGVAIFNNSLIEYFCDGGAVRTIISLETFEKIKSEAPGTIMEPYTESPLRSVNSALKIMGVVTLSRCLMSSEFDLKRAVCLVSPEISSKMCILGRDLSLRVPKMARALNNIAKTVQEMSQSIREKVREFPTVLKTKFNGRDMQLNITENTADQICGEINFSVKSIPLCCNETVPQETMIASIQPQEEPEEPRILEKRGRLEAELSTAQSKNYERIDPVEKQ